jgi:2-isopropylmalate synthase
VGASPIVGVNAQSGRANIMLLAESMGLALTSAQAQALMETNVAMIEGGGFTASAVSFRLACMRTLGSLRNWFAVKSWRVWDESDEVGGRFVQAFMSLTVGEGTVVTTRAEGAGPVDALTKAMRYELEKCYPALKHIRLGTFTVAALDVSAHDSAAHVRVTLSFNADGHESWITAGVSSDLNQAALMAIVDGFHFWLLKQPAGPGEVAHTAAVPVSTEVT